MKHNFVSPIADGGDPNLVGPNAWNDGHVFVVTSTSINLSLTSTHDFVACTGGAGGITITLPSAVTNSGRPFVIKKIDSGVGTITISPILSQTIDGDTSYILTNQWQFVKLTSDGTQWLVWGQN